MNVVKEYYDEKTKIRIHDDYIIKDKDKKETKELIISLVVNFLKNKNI